MYTLQDRYSTKMLQKLNLPSNFHDTDSHQSKGEFRYQPHQVLNKINLIEELKFIKRYYKHPFYKEPSFIDASLAWASEWKYEVKIRKTGKYRNKFINALV